MRERSPCVYLLASQPRGTIYIGVTSDLAARMYRHCSSETGGFTSRYRVHRLVRFELFDDMPTAIAREKQLKRWHRAWKINLVEELNPHWDDLAVALGLVDERLARAKMDPETSSGDDSVGPGLSPPSC